MVEGEPVSDGQGSMAHLPHRPMCRAGLCSPKAEGLCALRHCRRDLFDVGFEAL